MTISSHESALSTATPLEPRTKRTITEPRNDGKAVQALQKQQQTGKANDDYDLNDRDDDDDDDEITQLAHDINFSHLPISFSPYSSVHSDLKESGSSVHDGQAASSSSSASSKLLTSKPPCTEDRIESPLALTPRHHDSTLGRHATASPSPAPTRGPTPTLRAQSGTPATLGGFRRRENVIDQSRLETDHDASTIVSDMEDDQSQSAMYDYGVDEEPSEYVPPTTPKVGGFGVGTAKVQAGGETRPAEGAKVGGQEGDKGKMEYKNVQGIDRSESESWGANFWCIIEQPRGQSFFANPQTGECAWAVRSGTFVLPPRPEGQWWELYDEERKLAYYYHTRSKETQWEKPKGFVIPLASIQESTMGKRFSRSELNGMSLTTTSSNDKDVQGGRLAGEEDTLGRSNEKKRHQQPAPPRQEPSGKLTSPSRPRVTKKKKKAEAAEQSDRRPFRGPPPQSAAAIHRNRKGMGLTTIPSSSDLHSAHNREQRPTPGLLAPPGSGPGNGPGSLGRAASAQRQPSLDLISLSSAETRKLYRRERDPVKRRLVGAYRDACSKAQDHADSGIGLPMVQRPRITQHRSAPIFVNRRRSVSLSGLDARSAHAAGQEKAETDWHGAAILEAYAATHFASHRVGLLRRKYPLRRLVRWQQEPLRTSLLPLESNELRKDAVRFFKIILRYLGHRINPVFWPKVPASQYSGAGGNRLVSSSFTCALRSEQESGEGGGSKDTSSSSTPPRNATGPSVLDEVKWLLERALLIPLLRDEVYVQTMKEMTEPDNAQSWLKAWSFLSILLSFFPPSKELCPFLRSFIKQSRAEMEGEEAIQSRADYCLTRVSQLDSNPNSRARVPTIADIQMAEAAAFDPQVFGQTLKVVMSRQAKAYPDSEVPIVLHFLIRAMLSLDCLNTPGIFRVQGDAGMVYELQRRIDQGRYTLAGLVDTSRDKEGPTALVAVLASALKLWMRELKEPIFPEDMYNACLKASDDPAQIIELCLKLDQLHLRVVLYVVAFLQLFCAPAVIANTQMSVESIALIFTPDFVRSPSKSLEIVNNNIYYEKKFVKNLLRHLPCQSLDKQFRPSFDADLAWTPDEQTALEPSPVDNVHTRGSSSLLGIGGNGIGLTPRSRKSSTTTSQ